MSHQIEMINKLNTDFGQAVYYLLYNPHGHCQLKCTTR
jgi:hypothetical protein